MLRHRLHVNTGNLLEVVGAGVGCYAVSRLWGVGWALLVGAILLVAAAELVYDAHVLTVPLPRRPHPVARARSARDRLWGAVAARRGRAAFRVAVGTPGRMDRLWASRGRS